MGFNFIHQRKYFLFYFVCILSLQHSNAQSEASITGKVSNLSSRVLHFHFRNNPLIFDESESYISLDNNDSFSLKIQLKSPQILYIDLLNTKLKIFVSPNDNINLIVDCKKKVSETIFEGSNIANNIFLAKSVDLFPDWIDESVIKNAQRTKSYTDYQAYVENLFSEKKRFLDNYPVSEISNFSADFLDFVYYDLHFWKSRMLIEYYAENKNSTDPARIPDETFLSFIYETEISTNAAYNNDNYIIYLQEYLAYLKDKKVFPENSNEDLFTESIRLTQSVKPRLGKVPVLEDPFSSKETVDWINLKNVGIFLNIITTEKYKYIGQDTTFEDTFLKVRTLNGRIGWVPNSAVYLMEEFITNTKRIPRYCIDAENPLCGLEKFISGRALYLAGAIDILRSLLKSNPTIIDIRYNNFCQANSFFPDINNYLKTAYLASAANIRKGIRDIVLPAETTIQINNQSKQLTNNSQLLPAKMPQFSGNIGDSDKFIAEKKELEKQIPSEVINKKLDTKVLGISDTIERNSSPKTIGADSFLVTSKTNSEMGNKRKVVSSKNKSTDVKLKLAIVADTFNNKTINVEKNKVIADVSSKIPSDAPEKTLKVSTDNSVLASETNNAQTIDFESKIEKSDSSLSSNSAAKPFLPDASFTSEADPLPIYSTNDTKAVKFNGLTLNERIPDFSFLDINGKEVKSQDLLGKIIYLDFWATWCAPCQAEMTRAQGMAERLKDKGIVFIFISTDEDGQAWRDQVRSQKYIGIHGNDRIIIPINFMIEGIPNYFIIDKNGRIAYNSHINSHYTSEEMVEKLLNRQ